MRLKVQGKYLKAEPIMVLNNSLALCVIWCLAQKSATVYSKCCHAIHGDGFSSCGSQQVWCVVVGSNWLMWFVSWVPVAAFRQTNTWYAVHAWLWCCLLWRKQLHKALTRCQQQQQSDIVTFVAYVVVVDVTVAGPGLGLGCCAGVGCCTLCALSAFPVCGSLWPSPLVGHGSMNTLRIWLAISLHRCVKVLQYITELLPASNKQLRMLEYGRACGLLFDIE